MPILNKEDKKELEMYNNFVRNYPGASLMQDINWSKVKKNGIMKLYILVKMVTL